jgi:hypothetical protein
MPKSQKKAISSDKTKIQREISSKIQEKKERIGKEETEREKEIQKAILAIREDNLAFKPRELILKEENLSSNPAHGDVEYIFERIDDAREELLRLNLKKVRQIYVDAMDAYMKLTSEEKKRVYPELSDLYNERKQAEKLFA